MNIKDKFISLLSKTATHTIPDASGELKITFGQLFKKVYIVLHSHPDMKSFGVFEPVPVAQIKELVSDTVSAYTLHQAWLDGKIGNFGGFQTKLFIAYSEADSGNKTKLQAAFPEWFAEECEL